MPNDKGVLGRHTQTPLGDTEPFFAPFEQDSFGALRPRLSMEALRLSLELAATGYDLDVEQWLSAGWADVSVQAETRLYTGMKSVSLQDTQGANAKGVWPLFRSKRVASGVNSVMKVLGAIRQRKEQDSGKVLVMAKKHGDGRYVIALGFKGTSGSFYDWFSNFRLTSEGGFHKGFLQLAKQLEASEDKILFQTIADDLGLEGLTLSDIIKECRSPDSRFRIWLSGHSQGGAVLQVYAHLKLREDNVLDQNMVGYGFASPSVALPQPDKIPAAYPLFHLFNSDDFVPKMGSRVHYGLLLTYPTDTPLRERCYHWPMDAQSVQNRAKLSRITNRMADTPSCLIFGMAYLELLIQKPPHELHRVLDELQMKAMFLKQMLTVADRRDADVSRFFFRHMNRAYQEMTGAPMDGDQVKQCLAEMTLLADEMGVALFTQTLMQLLSWPHGLTSREGTPLGSYQYIVIHGLKALHASIWESGMKASRLWHTKESVPVAKDALEPFRARRRQKADRRSFGTRPTYSSRRR